MHIESRDSFNADYVQHVRREGSDGFVLYKLRGSELSELAYQQGREMIWFDTPHTEGIKRRSSSETNRPDLDPQPFQIATLN